jgi:putative cardiolipin synthase
MSTCASQLRRWSPLGPAALGLALTLLGGGCATLPPLAERPATTALAPANDTRLGEAILPETAQRPGLTGIHVLTNPVDAFVARMVLAAGADRTLDVQYYIWQSDTTGYLLFEKLWEAAERGVRVRLLLDDNSTKGLDPTLAVLDAHANIEVRLFNPVVHRKHRLVEFMTDFSRANRRMHNKSMTADNLATIVGGRNIGDEYFAAGTGTAFSDLDVLAVGAVVPEVSQEFDVYWASPSAYPAGQLLPPATAESTADLHRKFASNREAPPGQAYRQALKITPLVRVLQARKMPFDWCTAQTHYDDPEKILHPPEKKEFRMVEQLTKSMGRPQRNLDIVSPYFVPTDAGTAGFVELARSGVKVRILTNSLAATDVSAVHAGYAKHREDLLKAGVQLFELMPTAEQLDKDKDDKDTAHFSSSGASLHAKTFAVDGARIFVGSFNMDPRSVALNTEMGVLLESPVLAQELAQAFAEKIPFQAYEVRLTGSGTTLEWLERRPDGDRLHTNEPETGGLKRFGVWFMSLLPIESML